MAVMPGLGGRDMEIPGAHWPASLTNSELPVWWETLSRGNKVQRIWSGVWPVGDLCMETRWPLCKALLSVIKTQMTKHWDGWRPDRKNTVRRKSIAQSQKRWVEMWAAVRAQEGEINVFNSPESGCACLWYFWESLSLCWRKPKTTDFKHYIRIRCRILESLQGKTLFPKLFMLLYC